MYGKRQSSGVAARDGLSKPRSPPSIDNHAFHFAGEGASWNIEELRGSLCIRIEFQWNFYRSSRLGSTVCVFRGRAVALYLCWNKVGARKSLGFLYRWLD